MGMEEWLNPQPPKAEFVDLSDHHEAVIRCMVCDQVFLGFYPPKANPNRLRCTCGGKDSQVVRYIRFHYRQ